MKKFLFFFHCIILSISLSILSFAVSNEYNFSNSWNKIIFNLSSITTSSDTYNSILEEAPFITLYDNDNYFTLGFTDTTSFSGIEYSGSRSDFFIVDIPVNLRITNEDTLTWSLYFFSRSNLSGYNITTRGVTSTGSVVDFDTTLTEFDSGELNSLNVSSGAVGTIYSAEKVVNIDSYFNHNSTTITIERIQVVIENVQAFGVNGISSFILGAMGSDELVSIPSDVYQVLLDISNKVGLTNSRVLAMLTELRSMAGVLNDIFATSADTNNAIYGLIEQLDSVISSLGNSASVSQQINNYISMPSEQQQAVTEQLTELVSAAKEELAEIKEIISSVTPPTYTDIQDSQSDGISEVHEVLESEDLTLITDSVFSIPTLETMFLIVFALATISFILFGKKA